MGLLSSTATAGAVLATSIGLPLVAHAGPEAAWCATAVLGMLSGGLFGRAASARRSASPPT